MSNIGMLKGMTGVPILWQAPDGPIVGLLPAVPTGWHSPVGSFFRPGTDVSVRTLRYFCTDVIETSVRTSKNVRTA